MIIPLYIIHVYWQKTRIPRFSCWRSFSKQETMGLPHAGCHGAPGVELGSQPAGGSGSRNRSPGTFCGKCRWFHPGQKTVGKPRKNWENRKTQGKTWRQIEKHERRNKSSRRRERERERHRYGNPPWVDHFLTGENHAISIFSHVCKFTGG